MIESVQRLFNYKLYSFMEQINDKFFNVTFAIFDTGTIRVNISQYNNLYKKYLVKSINFSSNDFSTIENMLEGHEFDLKIAFNKAHEEFLAL